MKKIIFGMAVLILLVAMSCNKGPSPGGSNTWTFKGVTYITAAAVGSNSPAGISATSNSPSGGLMVFFYNALPAANGSYTVVSGIPSAANQISFLVTAGNGSYYSTGGNGSNETANVSVSGGKVSVSGSGIELDDPSNPSDSAALTLSMTQTQ